MTKRKYPTKNLLYLMFTSTSILIITLAATSMWQTNNIKDMAIQVNYLTQVLGSYTHTMDTYQMLDPSLYPKTELNGVYRDHKYFCVWTENKTEKEINNTFCHESCHDFVYKDYEGYCEDGHGLEFNPYRNVNETPRFIWITPTNATNLSELIQWGDE